jgi:hypothetical protein
MTEFEIKRENFIKPFKDNVTQAKLIPAITAELFERQFGITIQDPEHTVPIVFTTGWKHILKFAKSQPSAEFAIDVCGLSLEYVTEYSESDKPTNIIPQLVYKSTPIFTEQEHGEISAASIDQDLLASYNNWRSTYMSEVLDKVENDTETEVRTMYGIGLMHSAAVTPMLAAAYAAGIQIAETTHETVNMYSLFEIDVFEEDGSRHITPLAAIKQGLKDDDKRAK